MKTKITVETKKGATQETTWSIKQGHPYPDIERGNWRNGQGLFPEWQGNEAGMVARGIPAIYYCDLLRSDLTKEKGDRTDHAGFTENKYNQTTTPNPGTIVYRGKDLGEMNIVFNPYGNNNGFVEIGRGRTDGERAFIEAQIIPALKAAIDANKGALRAEAIRGLEERLEHVISEMRADADKLEKEAADALKVEKARKV